MCRTNKKEQITENVLQTLFQTKFIKFPLTQQSMKLRFLRGVWG